MNPDERLHSTKTTRWIAFAIGSRVQAKLGIRVRRQIPAALLAGLSALLSTSLVQAAPPAAPTNLVATNIQANQVTLSWQDNSNNETSFRIARLDPGEDPNNPALWDLIATVPANQTSYVAAGLLQGSTYRFHVRAANGSGYSGYTNDVIVTTLCPIPINPTNLAASSVQATQVTLTWLDNSSNETAFRIARLDPGEDPNNPALWDLIGTVSVNQTSYVATGLTPNSTYRFHLRAANDCGYSGYTNDVIVNCAYPADPTNISASGVQPTQVTVNWLDNSNNETSFRIAQLDPGEDPNNPALWDLIGTTPPNQTSFVATGLTPNSTYRLHLRAANDCGYSNYTSDLIVTTPCPVPGDPTNLVATSVQAAQVTLTWMDNSNNETEFRIARLDPGEDPNNPSLWDLIGTVPANQTSFVATGLLQNSTYRFRIRAANGCGYSNYTNDIIISTSCPVPADPTNLVASNITATQVLLTWLDNANNEAGFQIYRLDPGEDPANPFLWDLIGTVPLNETTYLATGLVPNSTYRFRIRGTNGCGYSGYSNAIIVNSQPTNGILGVPSPFPTIQSAIDAAHIGEEVVIADGTYSEQPDFRGKAITVRSASGTPTACIVYGLFFHSGETPTSVVSAITVHGGGIYCDHSGPALTNCVISGGNTADQVGPLRVIAGGVSCVNSSNPMLTNCIIKDNIVENFDGDGRSPGGVLCLNNSNPRLVNCRITGNTSIATITGPAVGGISCIGASSPELINCIITGNGIRGDNIASYVNASALYCERDCYPILTNCTMTGNPAQFGAGVVCTIQSVVTMRNCVLWNNPGPWAANFSIYLDDAACTVNATHSDIQGGWQGVGNIDIEPQLTFDGHLPAGSPCIDAGDNSVVPAEITTDIDGDPRIVGGICDMGADELKDSDSNGLPDWWEQKYFGLPTGTSANIDSDADGVTNAQEYAIYGGNPVAPPYFVDTANGNDGYNGRAATFQGGFVGPKKTIQSALSLAQDGDTVLVAAGTYSGPNNRDLNFGGRLVLLRAPAGPSVATVDCGGTNRFIISVMPAMAEGFTIRNSTASNGGGVDVEGGQLMLRHCVIAGNSASVQGGGCYSYASTMKIDNMTIGNNIAPLYDCGVFRASSAHLIGPLYLTAGSTQVSSSYFSGPGQIDIARQATMHVTSSSAIYSNITGTGTITIDPGQQLLLGHGAVVDMSGTSGTGCADPAQATTWGQIAVSGQLVVRGAAILNANILVLAGDIRGQSVIHNNDIRLLQNPPGWGGEFFVEGTSIIECNLIQSDGDRFLDLDPDPDPAPLPRPTIGQGPTGNKITVNIRQGSGLDQGELLELRSVDWDYAAVGGGQSGAWLLASSAGNGEPGGGGYTDTWVLEKLEVFDNAKVNLTNRQGFVFQNPAITIPEALYVKTIKLHPGAVLNTGLQRMYYQTLVDENDVALAVNPNDPHALLANGSRMVDVPLLGFSLKVIDMENVTEFDVRLRKRTRDRADDPQPPTPPFKEGAITRENAPVAGNSMNHAMKMVTHAPNSLQASSVAAHGAFARAGEAQIEVKFNYKFCGQPTDELIVYLSDSPDVLSGGGPSTHLIEIARIHPPVSGLGLTDFALFSGRFHRDALNFTRGTYVELELKGQDACVLIDDFDPVVCIWQQCGDVNATSGIEPADLVQLLSEVGNDVNSFNNCTDYLSPDNYIDMADLLGWTSRYHDQNALLNFCNTDATEQVPSAGTAGVLTIPTGQAVVIGKPALVGAGDTLPYQDTAYFVGASTAIVSAQSASPSQLNGKRSGHARLVRDANGILYQLHATIGLARLSDGQIVLLPRVKSIGGNSVHVGMTNSNDFPLADAAFGPIGTSDVYVTPVKIFPPGNATPYRATAKLQLTNAGDYNLAAILGAPPTGTVSAPNSIDVVYQPDRSRVRELEVDTAGNVFVAAAQAANANDYILIFPADGGAEIPVSISGTVRAPSALHVVGDKLYLTSSLMQTGQTNAVIYRFGIQRAGNNMATGLAYESTIQVPGIRFITDITSSPADDKLWIVGFDAQSYCSSGECYEDLVHNGSSCSLGCPFGINALLFTDPKLASITNPSTVSPTLALSAITGSDLSLPISLAFAACGTGDMNASGTTNTADITPFVNALLAPSPTPQDLCAGDTNGDNSLNGKDVQPFVRKLIGP